LADDAGGDGVWVSDFAADESMAGDAGLERADGVIGFARVIFALLWLAVPQ
jgi:hypothetical protein